MLGPTGLGVLRPKYILPNQKEKKKEKNFEGGCVFSLPNPKQPQPPSPSLLLAT